MDILNQAFALEQIFRRDTLAKLGFVEQKPARMVKVYKHSDIVRYFSEVHADEYFDENLPAEHRSKPSFLWVLNRGWDYFIVNHFACEPEGNLYWKHDWYITFFSESGKAYHFGFRLDYRWMQCALAHCRRAGGKELDENDERVIVDSF